MNNSRYEYAIRWEKVPQASDECCPLCANTSNNQQILQVQHWVAEQGLMDAVRCGHCHSIWFPEAPTKNQAYPDAETVLANPDFDYLIYHYLELVHGLDWKAYLLNRMPHQRFQSVLEVGCNLGVALDFCQAAWKIPAMGLEPSAYGVKGSEKLSLPIVHKMMHESTELQGRQFDFIFATEVIEHVPDPLQF